MIIFVAQLLINTDSTKFLKLFPYVAFITYVLKGHSSYIVKAINYLFFFT
jgi:hypothetical protein